MITILLLVGCKPLGYESLFKKNNNEPEIPERYKLSESSESENSIKRLDEYRNLLENKFIEFIENSDDFIANHQKELIAVSSSAAAIVSITQVSKLAAKKFMTTPQTDIQKLVESSRIAIDRNKLGAQLGVSINKIEGHRRHFEVLQVMNNSNHELAPEKRRYFFFFQGIHGNFKTGFNKFYKLSQTLESDVIVINSSSSVGSSHELVAELSQVSRHLISNKLFGNPGNVTLYGHSLGAGIATQVAANLHHGSDKIPVRLIADRGFSYLSAAIKKSVTSKSILGHLLPEAGYESFAWLSGWNLNNKKLCCPS